MTTQKDRIEAAISHIQTSADIDRWAEELAVEALEKQIPMKTMPPELGISPRHPMIIPCGNCGMELEDRMWEYCPWCGQAIDWGTKK